MMRNAARWLGQGALAAATLLAAAWCFGAFYYCLPLPETGRIGAGLVGCGVFAACWVWVRRPWRRVLALLAALLAAAVWFGTIWPDPGTRYRTPWARMPRVEFDGDRVTIHDIRDFQYRSETDFDPVYRTETFDLNRASKLYFAVSHWDGLQAIAHTMLSFEFSDGKYVTLSVETRIPEGREQGAIPGLFKQFGLIMIFGTESDLLKLRATHRGETLYLYPTAATPEAVREAFANLARRAEELRRRPEFYNTLTDNCTTALIPPLMSILSGWRGNLREVFNGLIDRLAFEKGYLALDPALDFDIVKSRCRVRAGHPETGAAYSRAIRRELPPPDHR